MCIVDIQNIIVTVFFNLKIPFTFSSFLVSLPESASDAQHAKRVDKPIMSKRSRHQSCQNDYIAHHAKGGRIIDCTKMVLTIIEPNEKLLSETCNYIKVMFIKETSKGSIHSLCCNFFSHYSI